MNVAGDGDGDAFWHASSHPSEMIFTRPSSHIYYRSIERFQTVLIHKHRCTLMPLEKVIDSFERNLFGTSALSSVFSQREKQQQQRTGFLCISSLMFTTLSSFSYDLFCFVQGNHYCLAEYFICLNHVFLFTWKMPYLPKASGNKIHATVDTSGSRSSVCLKYCSHLCIKYLFHCFTPWN